MVPVRLGRLAEKPRIDEQTPQNEPQALTTEASAIKRGKNFWELLIISSFPSRSLGTRK
jgi:hypothetical protein